MLGADDDWSRLMVVTPRELYKSVPVSVVQSGEQLLLLQKVKISNPVLLELETNWALLLKAAPEAPSIMMLGTVAPSVSATISLALLVTLKEPVIQTFP